MTNYRPVPHEDPATTEPAAPVTLEVRDLTKTYGSGQTQVAAVRAVDLEVHAGEVVLVMGPCGSGKTTMLLMLGALLRPTAGSITVSRGDGSRTDIAATPERELPGCGRTPAGSSSRTTRSSTR